MSKTITIIGGPFDGGVYEIEGGFKIVLPFIDAEGIIHAELPLRLDNTAHWDDAKIERVICHGTEPDDLWIEHRPYDGPELHA